MRFSKEIIDQKLAQVPEDVRAVVLSDDASRTLIEIAKTYGLHIDQVGVLEEETLYVLLGLQTSEQFVKSLQGRMAVSQSTALGLARDVNSQIVSMIRSAARNMDVPATGEDIARADILSEIEDPTPTIHPISSADQTIAGPAPEREIIGSQSQPKMNDGEVAQSFISGKLTSTINLPSKKAVTTPENLAAKPAQKPAAKVDPYREPLA